MKRVNDPPREIGDCLIIKNHQNFMIFGPSPIQIYKKDSLFRFQNELSERPSVIIGGPPISLMGSLTRFIVAYNIHINKTSLELKNNTAR